MSVPFCHVSEGEREAGAEPGLCLDLNRSVIFFYQIVDQEESSTPVLAFGGDSLLVNMCEKFLVNPISRVFTGDKIAFLPAIDTECDLFYLLLTATELFNGVFQQIPCDSDKGIHGKKKISFQASAVWRHQKPDAKLCCVHHFPDYECTNAGNADGIGCLTDGLAGDKITVYDKGDGFCVSPV